ncbi:MAG TPA: metal ABC transporter ATP-binding protein [Solirubrobacteraceae bacterium]|nr:metal ABC transporter ATP-binding protein [Solirubrobacteraceae bacterium]
MTLQSAGSEATTSSNATALELSGVTVDLGGRRILDEVGFTLAPGELTGLIGSNGAGKTTLLRVILGLLTPTRGTVTVPEGPGGTGGTGGTGVGYVPQKFMLDPDMPLRGRDLVALGIDGHRLGLPRPSRARRELVQEMLAAVDAVPFADARVGRLSGGEQQRILIAHALISRPKLLLLDEPLANLDLRSAREVVSLLARIASEQQIAVLISAHEMNALLPVMDRVVYLADGRAACGTTDEVVRSDVLSRLYRHRVEVLRVNGRVIVVAGDSDDAEPTHPHHHDHQIDLF